MKRFSNPILFVLFVTLNNVWIWSVYLSRPTLHPSLPRTEAGEENMNGLNHGLPCPLASGWSSTKERQCQETLKPLCSPHSTCTALNSSSSRTGGRGLLQYLSALERNPGILFKSYPRSQCNSSILLHSFCLLYPNILLD